LLTQIVATTGSERVSLWVARELIAGTASMALLFLSIPGLRIGGWRGPLGLMRVGGTVVGVAGVALVTMGAAWDWSLPEVLDPLAPLGRVTGEGALAGLRWREIVEPLVLASAAGVAMVGLALVFRVHAVRAARGRIRGIVETIATAPVPGTLESALAVALSDPQLRIAYVVDERHALVTADGEPLELAPTRPGRSSTSMSRTGAPVAIVDHRSDTDPGLLSSAAGASMLVALDNERLLAAGRAQLRELRASQTRIVDLQDEVRRRVERDVHDGAQQRLLAIAFELRLARMSAESRGEFGQSDALGTAEQLALAIVEELRRICRNILPQVLVEGGLGMALKALGDESPVPLRTHVEVDSRPPARVEIAAYELVKEALHTAARRGAMRMSVDVDGQGSDMTIEVRDPADAPVQVSQRVADRLGAVGGVVTTGLTADGSWLRAVLPCE
jgi:signal transduction histidine kinase